MFWYYIWLSAMFLTRVIFKRRQGDVHTNERLLSRRLVTSVISRPENFAASAVRR